MKSWKLIAPHELELVKTPSENPGPTQVKIKVEESSVSLPDLHSYSGKNNAPLPITLGRLCVGMVTDTGAAVSFLKRGDIVFLSSIRTCKTCSPCKTGNPLLCENMETYGYDTDGFMRDFVIAEEDDCIKIPTDKISNAEAVFLDHISLAIQVLNVLGLKRGDYLAICGAGIIGNILGMVALYYQVIPVVIDNDQQSLNLSSKLGLYYTVNSSVCNAKDKVFHITGGKMVEHVAIISSSEIPIETALSLGRPGAKIATVERKGITTSFSCPLSILQDNHFRLSGISAGMNYSVAINILATKAINVNPLIEKEVLFDDIPETLKALEAEEHARHQMIIVKV